MSMYDLLLAKSLNGGGGGGEYNILEALCMNTLTDADLGEATTVKGYLFNGNSNLETVKMPKVNRIDAYAFTQSGISGQIDISKIGTVGSSAFSYCRNLTSAIIGKSVGYYAFSGCTGLKNVIGAENVAVLIGNQSFASCTALEEVNIPLLDGGSSSIQANAFMGCTSLRSVVIGSTKNAVNASTIANNAFNGCTALTDIYVPWSEGDVSNAPWGATNATIHYNS